MSIVQKHQVRVTATPNATMTTFASPTLGQSDALSLWQVEMADGAEGPVHVFDVEQIWHVLHGTVEVDVDGAVATLTAGDSVRVAGAARRRFKAAHGAVRMIVCGGSPASVSVPGEAEPRDTPPWIA